MPKIEAIYIDAVYDEDPDTSCIGQYFDNPEDDYICRCCGEYLCNVGEDHEIPPRGREYRFFKPYAGGEKEGTEEYYKYGKQDFERMEGLQRGDWHHVGIVAKATILIPCLDGDSYRNEDLCSAGLWGIESDCDEASLKEISDDQIQELRDYLESWGINVSDENWKALTEDLEI